jgi:hypothetical protein
MVSLTLIEREPSTPRYPCWVDLSYEKGFVGLERLLTASLSLLKVLPVQPPKVRVF